MALRERKRATYRHKDTLSSMAIKREQARHLVQELNIFLIIWRFIFYWGSYVLVLWYPFTSKTSDTNINSNCECFTHFFHRPFLLRWNSASSWMRRLKMSSRWALKGGGKNAHPKLPRPTNELMNLRDFSDVQSFQTGDIIFIDYRLS